MGTKTYLEQQVIPVWLKPYFWDTKIETLDLQKNRVFIIERLLNTGDEKALSWVFGSYSHGAIRDAVQTSRGLSLKTARCWQNYFDLKEEEMRCFGIFSTGIKKRF